MILHRSQNLTDGGAANYRTMRLQDHGLQDLPSRRDGLQLYGGDLRRQSILLAAKSRLTFTISAMLIHPFTK
jgi:hypothetical protein